MPNAPRASEIPKSSTAFVALGEAQLDRMLQFMEPVEVAPGFVLSRQGEEDRSTFLVISGQARAVRSGVELGRIGPGDMFGELALSSRLAHAFSVISDTPIRLARLAPQGWDQLATYEPAIALSAAKLVAAAAMQMLSVGGQDLGVIREQAFSGRADVEVTVDGVVQRVPMGTPAHAMLPLRVEDRLVVAALIDQKAVSLTTPLTSACVLAPLTTATLDGQRFFRRSQALLLLETADRVDPTLRPRLSHSLGFAQRVEFDASRRDQLPELAAAIEAQMKELVDADRPLIEEWRSVTEARAMFEARGWDDASQLLAASRTAFTKMVGYGNLLVASPGPLVPSTGLVGHARVVADGGAILLVYGPEGGRPVVKGGHGTGAHKEPMMATGRFAAVTAFRQTRAPVHEQHRWLSAVGIRSVGQFNQACIGGDVGQIIRVSEGFQEKRIGRIADQIAQTGEKLRIVAVAGPSSSGKTTFIRRLKVQLQVNGLRPVGLSLDDYYCDRELTPRDANGDYDFEALEALRLDLLEQHLGRITAGEEVQTPRYDFLSGQSVQDGGPKIRLGPSDVLLLEGIHGLNPLILSDVPPDAAFRVFICPLTQLPFDPLSRVHVSDVRLLRRIVRDRHGRGTPTADTIMRWPSVRAGERIHIFPFQEYADAVFDSSLIYEIAVLKVYAERYLLEVPSGHPAYTTAHRLLHLIDRFVAIYPDHVPRTSLLREFIGGSGFEH